MALKFRNSNSCTFRLLGIKMEKCPTNADLEERVRSLQKSLYEINSWFYFYDGVEFSNGDSSCKLDPKLFNDGLIYNSETTSISISAIVGKNGSGKSTIIDMFIRGMNNLSAAILGEGYKYPSAEHLHYIEDVYVSIAYYHKGNIRVLRILGRDITIVSYKLVQDVYCPSYYRKIQIKNDDKNPLPEQKEYYGELYDLFYSIVCNYSLYAFNYKDYMAERTISERITKIYDETRIHKHPQEEDYHWLKGLFHKNDGYQVPIVIQPMRVDGVLDVKKENQLAKERLSQLLFYKSQGKYPFRAINEKMDIVGIIIKPKVVECYNKAYTINKLLPPNGTRLAKFYNVTYNKLLEIIAAKYGFNQKEARVNNKLACNYLIYKTLKIASSYYMYESIYDQILWHPKDDKVLKALVDKLDLDKSHITLKWRRIINYLVHPKLQELYNKNQVSLPEIQQVYAKLNKRNLETKDAQSLHVDYCVPSIFDFDFKILDRTTSKMVPFEGLSSGERQMNYTISNIMYHLVNIDSAVMDYNPEDEDKMWYSHVNILLDEIELYYHPEMQRLFLYNLLYSLHSLRFRSIDGINILIVTHSPFVVSDLPQNNVLFLSKSSDKTSKTFGGNITSMLNDHFFLNQSMGAIAESEIKDIVSVYNEKNQDKQKGDYLAKKDRFQYVVNIIGEPFLTKRLQIMIDELEGKYCVQDIQQQIEQYQQKIQELEAKIQQGVRGKI